MDSYQQNQLRIKELLKDNPRGMTVTAIADALQLSRTSVAKYVNVMQVSGHLEMKKVGPAKVYSLTHRIPLSVILNHLTDQIFVLDSNLTIILANEPCLTFWKMERENLIGNSLQSTSFPLNSLIEDIDTINSALNGKKFSKETKILLKGEEYFFKMIFLPTSFEDGEIGIILILEDITKQKEVENALRDSKHLLKMTFLCLRDAAFIIEAKNSKILDCNPAASHIFGYSQEEMIGKAINLLHVDEVFSEEFQQYLHPAITGKGYLFLPNFRMKRKNGSVFPTEHSIMPFEDESGKTIGWVSIIRDITDYKRVEEEII
ncbi:MAG: PAS domain S-box protein [Promethearchaeota archaeon]